MGSTRASDSRSWNEDIDLQTFLLNYSNYFNCPNYSNYLKVAGRSCFVSFINCVNRPKMKFTAIYLIIILLYILYHAKQQKVLHLRK